MPATPSGTPRRVAVIGAGGRVGRAVTAALLRDAWDVTAVLREPGRHDLPHHPRLSIARGDAQHPERLAPLLATVEAAVLAVTPFTGPPESFEGFDPDYYLKIVGGLVEHWRAPRRRLVAVGLAATLRLDSGGLVMDDPALFPPFLRPFAEAHARQAEALAPRPAVPSGAYARQAGAIAARPEVPSGAYARQAGAIAARPEVPSGESEAHTRPEAPSGEAEGHARLAAAVALRPEVPSGEAEAHARQAEALAAPAGAPSGEAAALARQGAAPGRPAVARSPGAEAPAGAGAAGPDWAILVPPSGFGLPEPPVSTADESTADGGASAAADRSGRAASAASGAAERRYALVSEPVTLSQATASLSHATYAAAVAAELAEPTVHRARALVVPVLAE
ncbi:NAD(P)H-binding protein [Phytohabitans sp. ZYX-F-186]|uniref:NAD(P)H-binding protein n=1 Tax=Phytohabitans maris TaxID=3071409 RepID=A0ABU0ZUC1_9ACTN|nr:NAD(P)H-binding protein [Phytohabitans sp. ZYX-F-186]MDQ7910624.1 NAD(P)H-binding protein [Phytohabitans sp. ZYX-F-186]